MRRPPFFVFAHDLGQTPLQWEDLIVAMPPGVGAACPWLRGTRPGGARVEFSLAGAGAGLITALDENGAATGTLVGVGLGAGLALRAAATAPDRVDAVVAITPPAHASRRTLAAQRAAVRMMPRRTLAARNLDKDRLLGALKAMADEAQEAPLARIAAPVTLVVGAGDRAGRAAAADLAAELPDARLEQIPDVAGDLPRTAPAALAAIVFAGIDVAAQDQVQPWDLT
ncbi:MAG: alpha/beta fold hydrolase [Austwickia sp.]|nr:alpha/beta fold hydrolase [Actinomycetota bacterium]MCB1254645.1 alpha/beta fold hydrolase [Austwickia sp.]MCO5310266.1 alpha/beta fold hydrolase [Austwickia sp.]